MPPERFEPTIPASERPQTHACDRAATGIGCILLYLWNWNIQYYVDKDLSLNLSRCSDYSVIHTLVLKVRFFKWVICKHFTSFLHHIYIYIYCTHFIFYFSTFTIFGDNNKSRCSSGGNFICPLVTSRLWGSNVDFNILLVKTHNLYFSLNMRDQISHPCKTDR